MPIARTIAYRKVFQMQRAPAEERSVGTECAALHVPVQYLIAPVAPGDDGISFTPDRKGVLVGEDLLRIDTCADHYLSLRPVGHGIDSLLQRCIILSVLSYCYPEHASSISSIM